MCRTQSSIFNAIDMTMNKHRYKLINVVAYILATEAVDIGLISHSNIIIKKIIEYCFPDWAAFKVKLMMHDVDREIALLNPYKKVDYDFSETKEGETPLGGPMKLSAPWNKNK